MKADILDLQGKKTSSIDLPSIFSSSYRPDIIRKAFLAYTSWFYQRKGADPYAGQKTSAVSWQTGSGRSIMPRVKSGPHRGGRNAKGHRYRSKGRWFPMAGRYLIAPGTVGGRQAHPPKSQKNIIQKVNNKEMDLALASAITATTNKKLVKDHGHLFNADATFPIIVDDSIESMKKTNEILPILEKIGLNKDIERCSVTKIRSGRGKTRGRKYKKRVGPLFVVSEEKGLEFAARNIPGIDVVTEKELNINMLAPGGTAGRLTVWTKSAISALEKEVKENNE